MESFFLLGEGGFSFMIFNKLPSHLVAEAGGALCQEVLLDLEPGDQVQGGGQEGGEQEEKQGENKGLI